LTLRKRVGTTPAPGLHGGDATHGDRSCGLNTAAFAQKQSCHDGASRTSVSWCCTAPETGPPASIGKTFTIAERFVPDPGGRLHHSITNLNDPD
jgi:hypothetical protein